MDPELKAYLREWPDRAMGRFDVIERKLEAHDRDVDEYDRRFAESCRRFDLLLETLIRIEERLGTRRDRLRLLP